MRIPAMVDDHREHVEVIHRWLDSEENRMSGSKKIVITAEMQEATPVVPKEMVIAAWEAYTDQTLYGRDTERLRKILEAALNANASSELSPRWRYKVIQLVGRTDGVTTEIPTSRGWVKCNVTPDKAN